MDQLRTCPVGRFEHNLSASIPVAHLDSDLDQLVTVERDLHLVDYSLRQSTLSDCDYRLGVMRQSFEKASVVLVYWHREFLRRPTVN